MLICEYHYSILKIIHDLTLNIQMVRCACTEMDDINAMNRSLLKNLKQLWNNEFVIIDGKIRNKKTFKPYKIRRVTLIALFAQGYLMNDNGNLKLTDKGLNVVMPSRLKIKRKTAAENSNTYSAKKRAAGYVYKGRWIHEDDLARYDEFMMTEMRL